YLRTMLADALAFFFFQAEDGIRDFHVTGVQTCALPISEAAAEAVAATPTQLPALARAGVVDAGGLGLALLLEALVETLTGSAPRSEDRRVGKECRSRGAPSHAQPQRRAAERGMQSTKTE